MAEYPQSSFSEHRCDLQLPELRSLIERKFRVTDVFFDQTGTYAFVVADDPFKQKFVELVNELASDNFIPVIRRENQRLTIRVLRRAPPKQTRPIINLMLFLATIGSIFVAGYTLWNSNTFLKEVLLANANGYEQAALFAASLLSIIGLHELGHKVAAKMHRLDATMPYFIPGPPPFGTFGAVISLRSPPVNKDQLFDLGFSGPLVGFLATIGVTIFSFQTGIIVAEPQVQLWAGKGLVSFVTWPSSPLLLYLLDLLQIRHVPAGSVLIFTQIEFAAWVGALLTFLNILPIWQLDGGHISRAVFGSHGHKIATIIGLGVLFVTGYWFFALFLVLWMFAGRRALSGVEPLDDVSPLTFPRKLAFGLALVILVLCFVVINPAI